ncbi:hypothetical protein GPEL0_01f1577 [Geoanaerobacter pelophilus]|uniref:Uncharacterized protein n=1 Tax=Geoanaerobacter pelophilus TaxID=60036 RepID=A0ABQ0MGR9_9BACT|nr:hypothetical protein GPEL0_01f1577 [Geoanaerobacter pelophilus]
MIKLTFLSFFPSFFRFLCYLFPFTAKSTMQPGLIVVALDGLTALSVA